MEIDNIKLNLDNYIEDANNVKDLILIQLLKDNIINDKQFEEFSTKYQIIIFKRSWFKRWFNKTYNGKDDNYNFKIVKFED